ncbi:EamA-like transporter family protein [Leptospira broomii serovar Hurstbridge str. 5399]|uniref:EamA-like transporter family protein n=1 Tax=Leptospira broomii serovar Hurstbridge str. 5399 TaxID=1049789 RepID=T0F5U1_9LEPT|nr:DMT family transporter [Leptospira broomii]EQA43291.1 EamA-like transporter family protein [Leptospira broomii serovar Hurstbridge str. 5399]
MEESRLRTYLEFQISQLIISGNVLFAHLLPYSPSVITWGRTLFSSLLLGSLLYLRKRPILFSSKRDNLISFGLGVLLAVHWVTFFSSAQISSVAIAVLTLFTHPIWTVLLEPFYFKVKLKASDIAMAGFVCIGMWFLVPEFTFANEYFVGVMIGLISALTLALRNLLTKKYLSGHGSSQVMFHQSVATCVILSPVLFFEETFKNGQDWALVFLLGTFFTAIGHTMYVKAVFKMKVKTVGLLSTIQPVYSAILAWLILGEFPRKEEFIGGTLILVAAFVESFRYNRNSE